MNTDNKNQCPEFPFFGAAYPDATCIDGVLYDLDDCNDDGTLNEKDNTPCPFCCTEAFLESQIGEADDYETPEEFQEEKDKIYAWMESIKRLYDFN